MGGVKSRTYARFTAVFVVIGGLGIAAALYTLVHQRLSLPFSDTYTVKVEFAASDGVVSGLGQPVDVVGVNVGQVVGAQLQDGRSVVTLQIDRGRLPRVYANANAVLEPITPLHDMQVNLDPGAAPARRLASGATIGVARTSVPVPLSDLLSALDADTRTFLSTLIASLDQGTRGRGPDIQRTLAALGPTTAQVGRISRALAARRTSLARLVHDVAVVTRAAAQDRQLATVVAAGDQTLHAIASQDAPLRAAIAKLPSTLAVTRTTLTDLQPFAGKLRPTLDALLPSVERLPATFRALAPFAREATTALAQDLRPLVVEAQPLVRQLSPTLTRLDAATPHLSSSFQVLTYLVNELAYNPPGNDEGFMFWLSWFVHNFNSIVSSGDANGGIGRAAPLVTCYGLQGLAQLQRLLGVLGACPK
ncbi:MAG: hypothetical protein JWN32_3964 [Solirubrobacterales bacterium]|nr:hypothetical protein [Solirubrobacterales bacterium]